MQMTIRTLEKVPGHELHRAFLEAFSDYEIPTNPDAGKFARMNLRRGFSAAHSLGAFHGERLTGFLLLGVRGRQAYDLASGVIPGFRGQQIFSTLFGEALTQLKAAGIEQLVLEVLRSNTKAAELYRRLGCTATRGLEFFTGEPGFAEAPEPEVEIREVRPAELDWELCGSFWDFEPSWQNSIASLQADGSRLRALTARSGGKMIGYGVIDPDSGDIPQLAVDPDMRRAGIGSLLALRLSACSTQRELRMINIDSDAEAARGFCEHLGLIRGSGQFEMVRNL